MEIGCDRTRYRIPGEQRTDDTYPETRDVRVEHFINLRRALSVGTW